MPSMAELVCVPPSYVNTLWQRVNAHILSAMERGGMGNYSDVERGVRSGAMQLWLAFNDGEILAAAVTELTKRTNGELECTIVACGGNERDTWLHHIAALEDFARAEGCSRVRICGRPGWRRILNGYRTRKVIIEKELT